MAARQAMLTARRRPAEDPITPGLPAGQFVADGPMTTSTTEAHQDSAGDRLRAALELAPQIVDPATDADAVLGAGTGTLTPPPEVDLGDPSTWPAPPAPPAPPIAPEAPGDHADEASVTEDTTAARAAERAARRQAWAPPPRGRPWGLTPELVQNGPTVVAGQWLLPDGSKPETKRHVARNVVTVLLVLAVLAGGAVVATKLLDTKKAAPLAVPPFVPIAAWVTYHGPGFTAAFPTQPSRSALPNYHVPGVPGGAPEWSAGQGDVGYVVVQLPVAAGGNIEPSQMANAFVASSAAGGNGTVVSTSTSHIGPYTVEDATITAPNQTIVNERVMVDRTTGWGLIAGAQGHAAPGWQHFLLAFNPTV
jgi:hypothetical protein